MAPSGTPAEPSSAAGADRREGVGAIRHPAEGPHPGEEGRTAGEAAEGEARPGEVAGAAPRPPVGAGEGEGAACRRELGWAAPPR